MRRCASGLAIILVGAIVAVGRPMATDAATATDSTRVPAAAKPVGVGLAVVDVAVATVWRHASSPRAVDAPALANPVSVQQWLSAMTLAQRRALDGRADTQVLLDEQVRVVAVSGAWARVVVPDQPTPLDPRGYPGWIPRRQLVAGTVTGPSVTVVKASTWLRKAGGAHLLEISFGTQLHALRRSGSDWLVRLPDGRTARVASSSVVSHPLPATAASLIASARRFLGLSYLWAGTSGFGFDCSGLMHLVFRVHGIEIPRDSAVQATAGLAVRRSALRPGDLVFFATGGHVHHVGMYVGNGLMLHAPHTGARVQVIAMATSPLAKEYAGARRFLP